MTYAHTIYAAPGGLDNASGTKGDPASLAAAQALSRAAGANTLVLVRGGTYTLKSPLAFTGADAGITWQAFPEESPTISGGTPITGAWTLDDAVHNVWRIAFSGTTRELWVNGLRATRARSAAQIGWTVTGSGFTASDSTIAGFARPQDVELVRVEAFRVHRVRVASASGTAITAGAGFTQATSHAIGDWMTGVDWYENARELVQLAEGYWYHNRASGTLYYKPRTGETMDGTTPVVAGNLQTILTVTDVLGGTALDLCFREIAFAHATWLDPDSNGYSAVQTGILYRGTTSDSGPYLKVPAHVLLTNCNGVTFAGCDFAHLGAVAFSFEHCAQYNALENCSFDDVGAAGVTCGNVTDASTDPFPSDARTKTSHNTIHNCAFNSIGVVYYDAAGLWNGYADHTTVDHCEFYNTPYDAISFGWGWGLNDGNRLSGTATGWPPGVAPNPAPSATCSSSHAITNNRIVGWNLKLTDSGAIYLNSSKPGSVVSGNYITGSGPDNTAHPLYCDNGCDQVSLTGNAIDDRFSQWWFLQPGSLNATRNTITGNYSTISNSSPGTFDPSNTVSGNTESAFGAAALAIKAAAGRE